MRSVGNAPLPLLTVSLLILGLVGGLLAYPAYAQNGDDPPDKPEGLEVSVASGVGVNLSWDDPDDATITGYEILRRDRAIHKQGEFVPIESNTGSQDTTYTDATVAADNAYVYRVKAINAHGKSKWSFYARADVPEDYEAPEPEPAPADLAPTNLTAQVVEGGVSLTWDAPAEDADSVTGYKILRAQGEADLTVLMEDTGNPTITYTDSSAREKGATYAYEVMALREEELSKASNRAEVQVPHDPADLAPTNLTAQVVEGGVSLSWDEPAAKADSVSGYRVYRYWARAGEGGITHRNVVPLETGSTTTSYTDTTSTEAGETYSYEVMALRGEEQSQASNLAEVQIPHGPADLAPTNLTAQVVEGGVSLAWDAPAEDAGSVTAYRILRAVGEGELTVLEEDTGGAGTSYTDATATEAGATYTYQIKALRDGEPSQASNRAQAEIPAGPLAPSNLTARVAEGGVSLSWDAPSEDAGSVTGYAILRAVGEGELTVLEEDTGNATNSYTDATATEAGATYTYQVKALRDGEPSQASNRAQAEIPAGPLAPANLTAQVAEGGVSLSWDAPAEDAGSVTGYAILRAVGEGELTVLEQDTGNATIAYTDSGAMEKGTTYAYRVKALRDGELSLASNRAEAQIPHDPADLAPSGLNAELTDGGISLAWEAPVANADSVTGYQVSWVRTGEDGNRYVNLYPLDNGGTATTWVDPDPPVAGATYEYRVRADRDGEPSAWSNEARVKVPGGEESGEEEPGDPPTGPEEPETSPGLARNQPIPVDGSYYQGTMTVGEQIIGTTVVARGHTNTLGSLQPQPAALTVQGVDYTIRGLTRLFLTEELRLIIDPIPPSGLDFELILNGAKFVTSEATPHVDQGNRLYVWNRNLPAWSDGQHVALTLKLTQKKSLVWVSTFTVADSGDDTGFSNVAASKYGEVSTDTFSVRGTDYRVRQLYHRDKAEDPPQEAVYEMRLVLDKTYPTAFTLRIWGESYHSRNATVTSISDGVQYAWTYGTDDTTYISTDWPPRRASIEQLMHFLPGESVASAPLSLTATTSGTSTVNLSWDAPEDEGGLPIMGYDIHVSADSPVTNNWTVLAENADPTDRTFVHDGLLPGSTRYYRVFARNLLGLGDPSIIEATTDQDTNCDIWCAQATVVRVQSVIGYSDQYSGAALSRFHFTLDGTQYTVTGVINARTEAFTGVLLATGSNLPPESAVAGLSLFVGGVELPFSEAQRDTSSENSKNFAWQDAENFGMDNTIFTHRGKVDLRIGDQVVNVVTIAADSATVGKDSENIAEFTLTRTGSMANPLLVQMSYPELSADARACGYFAAGANTTAAKHFQFSRTADTTVTFKVEPYPEGEMCNDRLPYAWPYRVGSPNSATVTVVE